MPLIWLLIVGVAVGFLATRILKVDLDTPSTIALGVLGALVGGLALRWMTMLAGIGAGFVGALLGALILIWVWKSWIK
ncbi:MAG: GlsB/YeaQ/YmgE family stress response membrane protein [Pseudomonadota bacterium]